MLLCHASYTYIYMASTYCKAVLFSVPQLSNPVIGRLAETFALGMAPASRALPLIAFMLYGRPTGNMTSKQLVVSESVAMQQFEQS